MEGGWEVTTWEVFLPAWKFFFQAGTFSSRLELFVPGGKFFFQPVTLASDLGDFLVFT